MAGLERLPEIIRSEGADRVVVGLPLTLRGTAGEQAAETERFLAALREVVDVPVESFDERFTSVLAERDAGIGGRGAVDARAAAHLLTAYLAWSSRRAG